jgi:hypothetical protein
MKLWENFALRNWGGCFFALGLWAENLLATLERAIRCNLFCFPTNKSGQAVPHKKGFPLLSRSPSAENFFQLLLWRRLKRTGHIDMPRLNT